MNLPRIAKTSPSRRRNYDVVGLDFGASGIKAVRLQRSADGTVTVVAADVLPPLRPTAQPPSPLVLPKPLHARASALCLSTREAIAKLLIVPVSNDKLETATVIEYCGHAEPERFRFAYRLLESESRNESCVLAAGLPEEHVTWLRQTAAMAPGMRSLEVAGLAALGVYAAHPLKAAAGDGCSLVVDFGLETVTLGIFCHGRPTVVRQFGVGASTVLKHVIRDLGVDEETARGVLEDGSVDVRTSVHSALDPFLRQAMIAIDFAERRHNNRLQQVYVCGGFGANADCREELRAAVGLAPEQLHPWGSLKIAPDALPARLAHQELRFAAATGAALMVLENT